MRHTILGRGARRIALACTVAAALAMPAVAAAAECEQVSGDFVANVVPCQAPFCTAGTLTGDLEGTYGFAMSAANETPTGLTFEGASTITLAGGTLTGSDQGHINFVTGGFVTVVRINGGSGTYADAFGVIVATGNLTPSGTAGTYQGVVCTP